MKAGPAVIERNQTDGRVQTNPLINYDSISAYLHNTRLISRFLQIWILWIVLQSKSMEILHYLPVASVRSIYSLHSRNSMSNLISFRNSIPEALRATDINLALRLIFSAGRIEMLGILDIVVMTGERESEANLQRSKMYGGYWMIRRNIQMSHHDN